MTRTRTVLGTGYIALDVIRRGERVRQRAGGTATNVVAALTYFGWRGELVGRLGADGPARRISSDLRSAGVGVTGLVADPGIETPVVVHDVRPPRHRFIFTCPDCGRRSARYAPPDREIVADAIARAGDGPDVVFTDRVSEGALKLFSDVPGALKVLEPSSRGQARLVGEAAGIADIVKWSHELRGDLHAVVIEPREGQIQIESLGQGGVRFRVGNSSWTSIDAVSVEVVDTAGAGDWLTASFLDALPTLTPEDLTSEIVREALVSAQNVAALSCLYIGARTLASLPVKKARAAASRLGAGSLSETPSVDDGRRSRAAGVCMVCLRCG